MSSGVIVNSKFVIEELEQICGESGVGRCSRCGSCPMASSRADQIKRTHDSCRDMMESDTCSTLRVRCWEECVACVAPRVICHNRVWRGSGPRRTLKTLFDVTTLTGIDWLLHLSQKRYRDHAAHQLFVATLGSFLLRCKLRSHGGKTLKQWIAEQQEWEESEVDVAWWIASLLHDHAYPLEHMLKVTPALVEQNCHPVLLDHTWALLGCEPCSTSEDIPVSRVVQGLYEPRLLGSLRDNAKKPDTKERRAGLLEILDEKLRPVFEDDKILQAADEPRDHKTCYDHGILAAANLAALLDLRPESDSVLRKAVRAIALHNRPECYPTVGAKEDPLALLLILCDEFQEWGRRIVVNDEVFYESDQMCLDGLEEDSQDYELGGTLTVMFEYRCPNTLERTGWNYSKFAESKKGALERIRAQDGFPIEQVEYHVRIPHEVKFKKSKHDNGTAADEAESDGAQLPQSRL